LGGDVLGLVKDEYPDGTGGGQSLDAAVKVVIEVRQELRNIKHFELADRVRERLAQAGILLDDRPDGTIWRQG
jgi:cysteinyl-tRNA synthetase